MEPLTVALPQLTPSAKQPEELTVNVLNPSSEQPLHRPRLRAFLNTVTDPGLRYYLILASVAFTHLAILLYYYSSHLMELLPLHTFSTLELLLSTLIPATEFITIQLCILHVLQFPIDYSVTLSVTTQQMTLTRIACLPPSLTLPLEQVIRFTSMYRSTATSAMDRIPQNCLIISTTGHPIVVTSSKYSFGTAAAKLNRFLEYHRQNSDIPLAYTPLSEATDIFRAPLIHHSRISLPALSRMSFLPLKDGFKCVPLNLSRERYIDIMTLTFYMFCNTTFPFLLSSLMGKESSLQRLAISVALMYALLIFMFCRALDQLTPKKRIFPHRTTKHSLLRRMLFWLVHVEHVPVGMYDHIEITKYRGLHCVLQKRLYSQRTSVMGCLYTIAFVSDGGERQVIDGLSEGEAVCILDRLQHTFLHLLDNDLEHRSGHECDGRRANYGTM